MCSVCCRQKLNRSSLIVSKKTETYYICWEIMDLHNMEDLEGDNVDLSTDAEVRQISAGDKNV